MAEPYYTDDCVTLYHGDCLDVLAELPAESVDAVVTDPPYGLGFMGKEWDALPPGLDWAKACMRVLKPGGHLLAFGGTRTWHRLAVAVEDAGFEIRDSIAWLYGSGFPKSLDVSKAIDKAAGAEREVVGLNPRAAQQTAKHDATSLGKFAGTSPDLTAPATDDAKRWQGWGTALKPAFEPIVVGRKPLTGTVAANVLEHGTGALNIDACRIEGVPPSVPQPRFGVTDKGVTNFGSGEGRSGEMSQASGRWPANVMLDESQAAALDEQSGIMRDGVAVQRNGGGQALFGGIGDGVNTVGARSDQGYGGSGGASRFFPTFRYEAKAPTSERPRGEDGTAHPTVKPLDLMRWLIRLVTPPGSVVLDPFLGSGTTAEACIIEGFRCIGIERDESSIRLTTARLNKPIEPVLFGVGSVI